MTLNENGTLKIRTTDVDWSDTGSYTYDGNNNWFFDFNNSLDANASGNYEKLNIDTGITSWGNQSYVSCSLNK